MRYNTIYGLFLWMACCIGTAACNSHNEATDTTVAASAADTTLPAMDRDSRATQADTLVVDRKAAVYYEPDSLQIAQRKAAIGESNFFIGVEDYAYYLNMSHDFLDSARLPMLDAKGKRFLKFVDKEQNHQIIRLDTIPELWGIYFFDPAKKAKKINMTMIEDEYSQYFR